MWKCSNCNFENNGQSIRCEYCGAARPIDVIESDTMVKESFRPENLTLLIFGIFFYIIGAIIYAIYRLQASFDYNFALDIVALLALITSCVFFFIKRLTSLKILLIVFAVSEFLGFIISVYNAVVYSYLDSILITVFSTIVVSTICIVATIMLFLKKYKPTKVLLIIYSSCGLAAYFYNSLFYLVEPFYGTSILVLVNLCYFIFYLFFLLSICKAFRKKMNVNGNNTISTNLDSNTDVLTPIKQSDDLQQDISSSNLVADKLKELKELLDLGVITEEEFAEKRKKYIEKL